MLIALLFTTAQASDFAALYTDSGWDSVGTTSTKDAGDVVIEVKVIDGTSCLRGTLNVNVPAKRLFEVVTDIPASPSFSSEKLIASNLLARNGDSFDYYQHLDVPSWTMAENRFWVLRGTNTSGGDTLAFQWDQFDWRSAYPELAATLKTDHSSSIEPTPNFGAWKFTETAENTRGVYYLCSNPGGNIPEWVQKAAATKTVPNTVADVVREARRRAEM
ncbi:MAG: hypothetical protein GWP91_00890 [Rhodobacterales bacterium]|nr:hypothetical protein [Rhodobacterales bacterium]